MPDWYWKSIHLEHERNLSVASTSVVKKAWWFIVLATVSTAASASQQQDPTAPLSWVKKQQVRKARVAPVPELQSIVCKGDRQCYAILNDQVASKGERVSGYQISQVTPTQVKLKKGKQSWTLKLFSLDIKK